MRAIKWYNVFDDDIDDHGNLNPDARLIPLYYAGYNWDADKNPVETPSTVDHYDDSFNSDDSKNTIIEVLENGDSSKGIPVHVKHRGYSAVGYDRGRGRYNNIFDDWDANVPIDLGKRAELSAKFGLDPQRLNYDAINHIPQAVHMDSYKDAVNDDKASLARYLHAINRDHNSYEHVNDWDYHGKPLTALPFIIEGDDDDIVTYNDVINNGYDPGRDLSHEIQFKNIRAKRLPSGILIPTTADERKNMYQGKRFRVKNPELAMYDWTGNNFKAGPGEWEDFLNKDFRIEDAYNLSDKQEKFIIKDASNWLKKKLGKPVGHIADCCKDWRL